MFQKFNFYRFEAEKKALIEKCDELTAKFEKSEKEKDEMAVGFFLE